MILLPLNGPFPPLISSVVGYEQLKIKDLCIEMSTIRCYRGAQ